MEYLYISSVQDIKEGCMIAVLATKDARNYAFWIVKVMKVNKEMKNLYLLKYIGIQQIHTHFDGVYKPEMVVEKKVCKMRKRKCRNVNHRRIDIVNLEDINILVYDSHLTKKALFAPRLQRLSKYCWHKK